VDASSTPAGDTFLAVGGYLDWPNNSGPKSKNVFWFDADEMQWFKAPQELKLGQSKHVAIAGEWDWACGN